MGNTAQVDQDSGVDLETTNKLGQLLFNGLSTVTQIMLGVVPQYLTYITPVTREYEKGHTQRCPT